MSKFTISPWQTWKIPLAERPTAALFAIGVHGPTVTESHCVDRFWCVHLYTYHGAVTIDQQRYEIRPGSVGILPPGVRTIYEFPKKSEHACAHFALKEGSALQDEVEIPVIQDMSVRFAPMYQSMEEAIAIYPSNTLQAEVRLWDILWQLANPVNSSNLTTHKRHPAVQKATEIIELRLREPLSVAQIAAEVDLSQNHLTRLFHDELGTTVIGYIHTRRTSLAAHLLKHTHLPIKTIASQVGVSDARLFNKMIHRNLGASPAEIRKH